VSPRVYKRGKIIDALLDRLRSITTANGFETDAGLYVSYGLTPLTDSDPFPRIALTVGETQTLAQGKKILRRLPIAVDFIDRATKDDPLRPVEAGLGDMKRALFVANDKMLGGLLAEPEGLQAGEERHRETEPGSAFVGCQIDAFATYVEVYGAPEEP